MCVSMLMQVAGGGARTAPPHKMPALQTGGGRAFLLRTSRWPSFNTRCAAWLLAWLQSVGTLAKDFFLFPPSTRCAAWLLVWLQRVDIFAKDYLLIPIHDTLHWSLAIVCHPGAVGGRQGEDVTPCILHLDSMEGEGWEVRG